MRQVPNAKPAYLIIGNGRVARHFHHYFQLLEIECAIWHRALTIDELTQKIQQATHILFLISDSAIDTFIETHLISKYPRTITLIHFSGSLISKYAHGAHPLLGFNSETYSLEKYLQIPFVIDEDAPSFDTLLPGLPNQHVRLAKVLKAKYHALCVLSGNFSCLLWKKFFETLEAEFKIPAAIGHLYLKQQTENLIISPKTALTGPLVRGDQLTIEKNLRALENDPYQEIYKTFVTCYQQVQQTLLSQD